MSQPGLVRQLGTLSATALVVSNMIGVGIFTTTGYLAGDLGDPRLVVAIWVVGGLLALAGALCYAELGVNFQRSGGEYVYLSEAWGPAWGFVDGWVSFFAGFSAPIAAAGLAIAHYLALFDTRLAQNAPPFLVVPLGFTEASVGGAQLLALTIVVVLTLINLAGVAQVARLQNLLTATKLMVVAALLVLGFTIGHGDWSHFSQTIARAPTSLVTQFAVSLVFVFYAYSGWNAAVYVAEEIRDPERTLPFAILVGTLSVTALYVVLNVLYVYGAPLGELKYVNEVAGKAALSLFGDRVGGLFNAAMAVGLLATVNAMSMLGPRVYYAMARNGAFFPVAARIHPKWQSPWVAVLAQGLCCSVLILTGTFESLANYIGFTLFLFSALSVLALLKFRKRPGWKRSRWVDIAYPAIPLIYVAMTAWVFVYFVHDKGRIAIWSLLTVVAGAVAYHFFMRKK